MPLNEVLQEYKRLCDDKGRNVPPDVNICVMFGVEAADVIEFRRKLESEGYQFGRNTIGGWIVRR